MNLGEQIKILRIKRNLTQNKLATEVGVTQHYLSHIEKGNREPNRRVLSAIIAVLLKGEKIEGKEFSGLLSVLIEDIIPGSKCTIKSDITVELPGIKTSLRLKKKVTKIYDSASIEVLNHIMNELDIRDAFATVCRNEHLKKLVLNITKKTRIREMVSKFTQLKESQFSLVESILNNLIRMGAKK